MTFRVHFCTLLSFLLFILSFQTFPSYHILEGDISSKWVRQNSLHYIGEHIRILHSEKIILDVFHIPSQYQAVDISQFHYFDLDENGNPTNPNPSYGKAYRYQQPMSVRLGIEVNF